MIDIDGQVLAIDIQIAKFIADVEIVRFIGEQIENGVAPSTGAVIITVDW